MELKITDLKIKPCKQSAELLATCTATFNDALVVSGIKIKEGKSGIYISFPLGAYGRPVVYPASPESRREISNRILATYVVNHCIYE